MVFRSNVMNEDDRDYYNQLHQTARAYQTQLWAIPAVFFGLQIFAFQTIKNASIKEFLSLFNAVVLLVNGLFSFLLWLIFEKHYAFGILIHGQICEFDKKIDSQSDSVKRMPLYSMNKIEFKNEITHWEQRKADNYMSCRTRFAVYRRVSRIVSYAMLITIFITTGLSLYIFSKFIFLR